MTINNLTKTNLKRWLLFGGSADRKQRMNPAIVLFVRPGERHWSNIDANINLRLVSLTIGP